jgi:L-threonylcarbamoyladenylate synthase
METNSHESSSCILNHSVFLPENYLLEFEEDILSCLDCLRRGGTILYPTDTIWGIGCDATDPLAVKKIFELKKRLPSKSLIVLLADPREINRYVSRPQPYIADYLEKTERPTTVIYEGAIGLAENLIAEDGTIGIRIVREDFCRHLIKRFRKPLVSTSANISGGPAPQNFSGIPEEIKRGVDYVVKYRQADSRPAQASSLIRFNKNGEPEILRS